jgi:hypothetical protein
MRLFSLLLLLLSFSVQARTITTQIHDLDFGNQPGDEILLFLSSGDVVKLPRVDTKQLDYYQLAKLRKSWLAITVDKDRYVEKVENAPAPLKPSESEKALLAPAEINYTPTTVPSFDRATQLIRTSRQSPNPESQCFNRAHVWTYEWWQKHSLRSNKILIFWSRDYVRRLGFKWWFHIAPYVNVRNDEGRVVERVLDVKYISRPVDFQWWANYHSKVNYNCKVVTKYSDYANYPYGHDCYFMRTHMYTYQPADLEMYEAWGFTKNAFNMDEVRAAYLEAFLMNI